MTNAMDRPVATSARGRLRRWLPAGAGVLLLTLAAITALRLIGPAQRSVRVAEDTLTIGSVRQGVFQDFIPMRGRVVPLDTIYLDALEGGQVAQVFAQAGDDLSEGQPLVRFRNTNLELEVLDREGRLVESITQLQAYEKTLEQLRSENAKSLATIDHNLVTLARSANRRERLAAQGYLPLEKREEVRDEYAYYQRLREVQADTNVRQEALRVAQLPQVKTQLVGLHQSLRVTRSKLDNLLVRAPVSGRLTSMNLKMGQSLRPGERMAEITLDTGFKVSADVDEFYLGRVQVGQTATADIGGGPRTLRVARVYPEVKNGVFVIDLEFAGEQPKRLLPGEAVQGKLSLGGDRPALLLSAGPFLETSGGDWAFVLAPGGGRAERRVIRLGRRNTDQVEVLGGLRPGERVVISDVSAYEDVERLNLGT